MDLKQLVALALQVSIIATVVGFGLRATPDDMLYLVRRPGLLARSLVAMLVIMPVFTVVLARVFDFRPTVAVALVALAVSPVPPLLPRREVKAGGLSSYGLGLMATLALLSIVTVPVAVELLEPVFQRPFAMAPGAIAGVMVMMVLGPLAAGMAIRAFRPAFADRIHTPVSKAATVLLLLALVPLLVVALPAAWAFVGDGTVVAIVLFIVAGLAVGHFMGAPEPQHSTVLALSTACRHPAIALAIAATNYPDERFGGIIVLYLLLNAVVCIPYVSWQRRQVAVPAA